MRSTLFRGGVAVALIGLLFSEPVVALYRQSETQEACQAAEADAEEETSGVLWFIAGCCTTLTGVLLAYLIKPSPTASKLLGKSPEYVAAYTDCYKDKAVSIQTKWAWIGCGVTSVLYVAVYAIVLVAASAAANSSGS